MHVDVCLDSARVDIICETDQGTYVGMQITMSHSADMCLGTYTYLPTVYIPNGNSYQIRQCMDLG